MRIVQGRGGPTVLVPLDRDRARRQRRVRTFARALGGCATGAAAVLLWRAAPIPRVGAAPPIEVAAAVGPTYLPLTIMALGFLLALLKERAGGFVMSVSAVAWLIVGPAPEVPLPMALVIGAAGLIAGLCFIWLGNASR
ncbi:MAG TPA: hypothetical protein VFW66_09205 [Gemmatimonadales bacterium]|nr:hypothetical protein [Gemmatimonadales bacterium]